MSTANLNNDLVSAVADEYHKEFGVKPTLILRSPGRINLIGEHTDYNDGLVLPSAVDLGIYMALGVSPDDQHHWIASDLEKSIVIGPDELNKHHNDWTDFVHGAWLKAKELYPQTKFFRMVCSGDLPIASGLSSSSALTCGTLGGLNALFDLKIERHEIAEYAHQVEREFIGVRGGIMDQYSSVLSEENKLLLIDCRTKSHKIIDFDDQVELFLIHSNVQRELTGSDYNSRSDECARAVEQINAVKQIDSLRDVRMSDLLELQDMMDPIAFRRAEYVIRENTRVISCVKSIGEKDWSRVGELLYAGHKGLSRDFQVSTEELDFLVDFTKDKDWIFGARMMGGGFGGCTINLASRAPDNNFEEAVTNAYSQRFGFDPTIIRIRLAGGTEIIANS